jgi:hypothetical protein
MAPSAVGGEISPPGSRRWNTLRIAGWGVVAGLAFAAYKLAMDGIQSGGSEGMAYDCRRRRPGGR